MSSKSSIWCIDENSISILSFNLLNKGPSRSFISIRIFKVLIHVVKRRPYSVNCFWDVSKPLSKLVLMSSSSCSSSLLLCWLLSFILFVWLFLHILILLFFILLKMWFISLILFVFIIIWLWRIASILLVIWLLAYWIEILLRKL